MPAPWNHREEVFKQLDTKYPLHDSIQIWFNNRQTQAVKLEVGVRAPCGEMEGCEVWEAPASCRDASNATPLTFPEHLPCTL